MECSEANVKKVKKSFIEKIKKEESILECVTVELSICSPQAGKKLFHLIKKAFFALLSIEINLVYI